MNQKLTTVLFLKIGKVQKQKRLTSDKEFESGIKKSPVKSAYLEKTGFIGDEQADMLHHGGETKAVLFLSTATYQKLNELSGNDFKYDGIAHYGENIVADNIDEADICVGDVIKVGDATVEVSQPRQPCWKLSANTGIKPMTSIIYNNGLTGWYARVLEQGEVSQGDEVHLIKRPYPTLTIKALNQAIVDPHSNRDVTIDALNCPILGEQFKASLASRVKIEDAKNEPFWYHTEPSE